MVTFSKRIMRATQAIPRRGEFWVTRPNRARPTGLCADLPVPTDGARRLPVRAVGAGATPVEEGLDQAVEVTVEDGLHVAGLEPGPLVLDELVRLHRVRADLAPEVDAALLPRELLELGALVLALLLGESGGKDLHRLRLVLQLRPLVLTRHDDAGGQVRDADRGVGDVHVLAARARRPVGVDPQVARVDLRRLGLVQRRHRVECRERGLAACVGVERRDPDEPMYSLLAREHAV